MIICATGHRPPKVCSWQQYEQPGLPRMTALAKNSLIALEPEKVISGMALGWDTAISLASLELGIPLIAAVPFEEQERTWQTQDRNRYCQILDRAHKVCYVYNEVGSKCSKQRVNEMMKGRDRWMVDRADKVLALFNGTPGGTWHTVRYAESIRKPVVNVWKSWVRYRGF